MIDNVADFKKGEFSAYFELKSKELAAVPFNSRCYIRDIYTEVREAGYEPAMPEDLLGLILSKHISLYVGRFSRLVVVGRIFNRGDGMCLMVFESVGDKIRLTRERVPDGGLLEGKYSVLVFQKPV